MQRSLKQLADSLHGSKPSLDSAQRKHQHCLAGDCRIVVDVGMLSTVTSDGIRDRLGAPARQPWIVASEHAARPSPQRLRGSDGEDPP